MWKRPTFNRDFELEALLRRHRAEPRDVFVARLAETVQAGPTPRRAWSRVAFAGAVSVFILGTFASFGGLGYAASGAASAYHATKQVTAGHFFVSVHKSSAASQYAPKPKHKRHQRHVTGGLAGVQAGVTKTSGSLPFTGLSLLATLLVSLALIGLGIALQRGEAKNKTKG